jgi:hypothetical protein
MKRLIYLTILFILISIDTKSTDIENLYQTRNSLEISKDFFKDYTLELCPEIRYNNDFKMDSWLIESNLNYEVFKYLDIYTGHRFIVDKKEENSENFNRFHLGSSASYSLFKIKAKASISYTNYFEDLPDKEYLRYKASLKHKFKELNLTPSIAVEFFHRLNENILHKIRSKAGLTYKLMKKTSITASYKFDFYKRKYKNLHIFEINLSIKL